MIKYKILPPEDNSGGFLFYCAFLFILFTFTFKLFYCLYGYLIYMKKIQPISFILNLEKNRCKKGEKWHKL